MNWKKLHARTVRGDSNGPLIIALHGFGQRVQPAPWYLRWMSPDYLDFEKMTGLAEECSARNISLWMPQAPMRNWRPQHAAEAGCMIAAAQKATGNKTRPHVMGFSDGATLVNRLLFGGVRFSSYVSYEGMYPLIDCRPRSDARCLFICGGGDGFRPVVEHSEWTTDMMTSVAERKPGITVEFIRSPLDHHEWLRSMTPQILDWVSCA